MVPTKGLIFISSAALIGIPLLLKNWIRLYNYFKQSKGQYDETFMFMARHNCVVKYDTGEMSGYPPNKEPRKIEFTLDGIYILYEPLNYFIETAQSSLDIGISSVGFGFDNIMTPLVMATKRGITVRIILTFEQSKCYIQDLMFLEAEGINVTVYMNSDVNSDVDFFRPLMDYTFIVKDCSYACLGSFDLTYLSFLQNKQDLILTPERSVVESFNAAFKLIRSAAIKKAKMNRPLRQY